MTKILFSCLIGISLSLVISWIIFQTDFFHQILIRILGRKEYDDWHSRFNSLIGEKSLNLGFSSPGKATDKNQALKESQNSRGPVNWQEQIFTKIKASPEVKKILEELYNGKKKWLSNLRCKSGLSESKVQSYCREILANEQDFSHFNSSTLMDYLSLRCFLIDFRVYGPDNLTDREVALMGIYLSKCGVSEQQLHRYWKQNKNSIKLKFKARSDHQLWRVEKELSYQYMRVHSLEKQIKTWVEKMEKEFSQGQKQKQKQGPSTKSNILRLNPEKYQDALKIFEIQNISSKSSLKKQYRKLALKFHPDRAERGEKALAHKNFVQVQKAYETLQKYAA